MTVFLYTSTNIRHYSFLMFFHFGTWTVMSRSCFNVHSWSLGSQIVLSPAWGFFAGLFRRQAPAGGWGGWRGGLEACICHHLLEVCEHRRWRWGPLGQCSRPSRNCGGGKPRARPLESLRFQNWNHGGAFLYWKLGHSPGPLLGATVGKTCVLVWDPEPDGGNLGSHRWGQDWAWGLARAKGSWCQA